VRGSRELKPHHQLSRSTLAFSWTSLLLLSCTSAWRDISFRPLRHGFITGSYDCGTDHPGLSLLANFQPDMIKIDMELVRGLPTSRARQAIVAGVVVMAPELDIAVIVEGVETHAELTTLQGLGIRLFQGNLFAKPAIAKLSAFSLSRSSKPT
jgi:EAL domain-containing protein (putative c-di-GMP-specific phosphodiesterase class I)